MFGHVAIEFALCGLPKGFSREVPTMCFDGVARVSRAAAQLAFFVAVALDVYQGKAIWNVYIDSLFLNALPVPMLATVFLYCFFLRFFQVFWPQGGLKMDPQHGPKLDLVLGGVLERFWEGFWKPGCA